MMGSLLVCSEMGKGGGRVADSYGIHMGVLYLNARI